MFFLYKKIRVFLWKYGRNICVRAMIGDIIAVRLACEYLVSIFTRGTFDRFAILLVGDCSPMQVIACYTSD